MRSCMIWITMCSSQECNNRIWKIDIQKFRASHKLDSQQPNRDLALLYRLLTPDKVRLGMSMPPDVCCLAFLHGDTFLGHESWVCKRKCVLVNLLFFCKCLVAKWLLFRRTGSLFCQIFANVLINEHRGSGKTAWKRKTTSDLWL